ncbi:hypothetical protein [Actinokineospora enzanensis]|uniref:hypothetical protein n=1 Tax=Actinokineospora enzanensis TaxID=155975 RepID=UPI000360C846|nr:hypothetical protein [Actinokineospora enzanensis]
MGSGRVAAAVCALTLVSGCGTVFTPPPDYAHGVDRPVDVAAALGDLPTLDPCSLFDPSDFGATTTALYTFSDCDVSVGEVHVSVGSIDKLDVFPGQDAPVEFEGMTYLAYSTQDMPCGRLLQFGSLALAVFPWFADTGTMTDACDRIAAGFEKMLKRLKYTPYRIKHRTFAPTSLGGLDPCRTTPSAGLRVVKSWPTRHTCLWNDPDGQVSVQVSFGIHTTPPEETGSERIEVAGRPTVRYEIPIDDSLSCRLSGDHTVPGQREHESVNLTVYREDLQTSPCDEAKTYAAQLWPTLPPAK